MTDDERAARTITIDMLDITWLLSERKEIQRRYIEDALQKSFLAGIQHERGKMQTHLSEVRLLLQRIPQGLPFQVILAYLKDSQEIRTAIWELIGTGEADLDDQSTVVRLKEKR